MQAFGQYPSILADILEANTDTDMADTDTDMADTNIQYELDLNFRYKSTPTVARHPVSSIIKNQLV